MHLLRGTHFLPAFSCPLLVLSVFGATSCPKFSSCSEQCLDFRLICSTQTLLYWEHTLFGFLAMSFFPILQRSNLDSCHLG